MSKSASSVWKELEAASRTLQLLVPGEADLAEDELPCGGVTCSSSCHACYSLQGSSSSESCASSLLPGTGSSSF